MVRESKYEAVYEVANQWRNRCLADDKSLLWPKEVTWTEENIELATATMGPLVQADTCTDKDMHKAFSVESVPVRRILADALAVWNICPVSMTPKHRKNFVHDFLTSDSDPNTVALIDAAIDSNIGEPEKSFSSGGFQLHRGVNLVYIFRFAINYKMALPAESDWKAVQEITEKTGLNVPRGQSPKNMILHMLYPDVYEAVFNQSAKEQIVFSPYFDSIVSEISDLDERLRTIRAASFDLFGRSEFNFFDEDVMRMWRESPPPKVPRYWKIAPGDTGSKWKEFHTENEIAVEWKGTPDLSKIKANNPDELKAELTPIFKEHGFQIAPGIKQLWMFYREMKVGDVVCAYGAGKVLGWGVITGEYTFDVSKSEFRHRRKVDWTRAGPTKLSQYSKSLQERLTQYVTIFELTKKEFDEISGSIPPKPEPMVELSEATHFAVTDLEEIDSLLRDKRQLIFEGPPGAGKTYLADLFARHFTGNSLTGEHNEQIEIVQFHQSYGYEDFVQGIRPVTDGSGNLQYRVVPGIFLQMCDRSRKNSDQKFVLIIDEINRGNLSRIFGELLMLLEYRDKRVRLPYAPADSSDESGYISIPKNLYLIGTMNSTDRSLAMIDYALRRRFYFYRLMPVEGGSAPVLSRWLNNKSTYSSAERKIVLDYFLSINTAISQRLSPDFQIGHSYFMVDDINTPAGLNRVWQRSLKPLLEEYFHSHRDADSLISPLAPGSGLMQHISAVASMKVIAQPDSLE